jgi:hypothetical protein
MTYGDSKLRAQRAHPRQKLFHPVRLLTEAGEHRAHLLDISASGALVHTDAPLCADREVKIIDEDFQRSAAIAWVNGNKVGLRFLSPLTDQQAAAIAALEMARLKSRSSGPR